MKPILLFFHGILGTHADWEGVASYLDDFACIGIDLPGHGDTPFSEDPFSVLPEISPPFHLIGYSMGGRLAMQFAMKHPEKIQSLTLLSAHFGLTDPKEKEKRYARDLEWSKQFLENPIDEVLKRWYDQPLFKSLKVDFEMRCKQNREGVAAAFKHYSVALQPFIQPKNALYLLGEWDLPYRSLYEKLNPVVIPKAGHAIHLENPQAVAMAIRRYLCSLGKTQANTPI